MKYIIIITICCTLLGCASTEKKASSELLYWWCFGLCSGIAHDARVATVINRVEEEDTDIEVKADVNVEDSDIE